MEYKKTDVAKPSTKGELEQEIGGQDEELEEPNAIAGDGGKKIQYILAILIKRIIFLDRMKIAIINTCNAI